MLTISAIVPTCDRPQYLAEAIESIRNQSFQPIEIIIVNNGQKNLRKGSLGNDVRIINLDPYVGVSSARNAGAKAAKGQLIAFLDDDDQWEKGFLKHLVTRLTTEEADCVVGDLYDCDSGTGAVAKRKSLASSLPDLEKLIYRKNPGFGGGNFLIQRETFLQVGGFDEDLKFAEDQTLAISLLSHGCRIVAEPKAHYLIREHDGDRLSSGNVQGYLKFYKKHKRNMPVWTRFRFLLKTLKKALNF